MKDKTSEAIEWLSKTLGQDSFNLIKLRQEASSRSYFRVSAEDASYILSVNEKNSEQAAKFLYSSKILKNHSVSVPDIYAFSENLEFILQEDFGDKTLDTANSIDESNLINQALSELSKIYAVDQSVLKSFTEEDLLNQTNNFFKIFSYKKNELNAEDKVKIDSLRKDLVNKLMQQPFFPAHNDFERRNFLICDGSLCIIDHQDLNIAPIGIDLASLLFDHDFSFDDKLIDAALSKHIGMNALNFTSEELKNSILVALAHRSMRIVGTFICYFEDGHLLNRKKDIDKFLNRIVYSLDELNYSQQSKLIKRLL